MKKIILSFIFVLFLSKNISNKFYSNQKENENIFDLIKEEQLKFSKVEDIVNEYLQNPKQFISSHNNKENFIAIFSNFTNLNGEVLYNEYVENSREKDLQAIIDNINRIRTKHVAKWEYDTSKGKFILPDDSKNLGFILNIVNSLSDYFKWQMVVAILRSMKTYPVVKKDSKLMKTNFLKGSSNLIFPDNSIIENPPI